MDPRDRLRSALDGVTCAACGASVPADRIRILARRDPLHVIELGCPACGSTEIEVTAEPESVSLDDVTAMRELLSSWRGDLLSLLDER